MKAASVALLLCAATPAAAQDFVFFQSPTGNIHCVMGTGDYAETRCDIVAFTPSYRTRPGDCDLEWGDSFAVRPGDRKGQLVCHGDTVISPDALVLDYGRSVSLGGVTCTSEKTGMTCTNGAGHGFTVAKARQRVF